VTVSQPTSQLSIQKHLSATQWWTPEKLLEYQFQRLARLLEHSWRTVPFYRSRLETAGLVPGRGLSPERWRALPLLTRRDIQRAEAALHSSEIPQGHGPVFSVTTSGSTGMPVTVQGTALSARYLAAFVLRNHLWHRRDFSQKIGFIGRLPATAKPQDGCVVQPRWGDEATYPFQTGPAALIDISTPIERQAAWLATERPAYLVLYPSVLAALLEAAAPSGATIEEALTFGEVVTAELREACWRTWNARVVDSYSAQEVGVIALQCPGRDHYHVQSEAALVEVLDDSGNPVKPGAIGKVVVTPLYNFAMPLVRYEIGDYAEVGETCACGRGLPVLRRILGRARNVLRTPEGLHFWPRFGSHEFRTVAPIVQYQVVQTRIDAIEGRLVTERPLTAEETARLERLIRSKLPYPFEVRFRFCDSLPRQPGGKYEDFRSEIASESASGKFTTDNGIG
jgi:phenylacetate-coenzyme A ligase PaaK-like adenylate-forming protein